MTNKRKRISYDALKEYSEKGLSDTKISELLEVSSRAIYYARERLNSKSKLQIKKLSYDLNLIRQMATEGKTKKEISEETGINYQALLKICHKYDITTSNRRRRKKA